MVWTDTFVPLSQLNRQPMGELHLVQAGRAQCREPRPRVLPELRGRHQDDARQPLRVSVKNVVVRVRLVQSGHVVEVVDLGEDSAMEHDVRVLLSHCEPIEGSVTVSHTLIDEDCESTLFRVCHDRARDAALIPQARRDVQRDIRLGVHDKIDVDRDGNPRRESLSKDAGCKALELPAGVLRVRSWHDLALAPESIHILGQLLQFGALEPAVLDRP